MSYAFTKCLQQQTAFELAEEAFISFLESLRSSVMKPLSVRRDVDTQKLQPLLSGIQSLLQFHNGYKSAICPPPNSSAHGRNLGHSLSRNQGATALSLSDTLNERVFVHYAYFPAVYGDYLQSVLAMGSLQALSTAVAKRVSRHSIH